VAADKYLYNNAGAVTEKQAKDSSAGAGDAGKIVALDSTGRLDISMMPVGVASEAATIAASENLAAGDWVNIHNAAGSPNVRKADASNGRRAHGFVLASVTSGQDATVYQEGTNTALSGLTPGATYFLSGASAGAGTTTAPSTSAYIVQELGYAISATAISFEPSKPITLA